MDDLLSAERVDNGLTPRDVRHGRFHTVAGAALAALFGCGALVAGAALASRGVSLDSLAGADFPRVLEHALGGAVGTGFALGLIEAGAVAMLTISASTGYALAQCLGVPHSMSDTALGGAVFQGADIGAAALAAAIVLAPDVPLLSVSSTPTSSPRCCFRSRGVHDDARLGPRVDGRVDEQSPDEPACGRDRGVHIGVRHRLAVDSFLVAIHVV